jgi:predicted nucleic acid-binding protein
VILVDSSIWLARRFRITDVVDPKEVTICGPIVYEVLRGARPEQHSALSDVLYSAQILDDPMPTERYEQAALIYRALRAIGITIESSFDCVIAAVAMHYRVELLHRDHDFDRIAEVMPLRARNVSLSA